MIGGLEPLNAATRNDLMEIMDDRYEQSTTIIISQLPTEQWYEAIGDNILADAILDRLMHNAHRMNLPGESMRKKLIPWPKLNTQSKNSLPPMR